MADPAQILVIDDDAELCELLAELLGQEGYAVESARDAATGLARAQERAFTLVVLDVMLPGMNGFEVLTRLRQSSRVPVLMLTARGEDVDRIVGLEMGADDYLPKPFNPRELVARVRALHRRAMATAAPGPADAQSVLTVDDLELLPSARRVRVRGEDVRLTTAEYDLLEVLVRQAGAVVSREELARRVLGRRLAAYDRGIDMHVSNLRKKLGPGPSGGERIKTVRNAGYILARERP
ncbi:transcriptional regulator [Sorangium cellulosum]|uniref:Transcriptional regulator n=1 Tax=Sorangium cellulosum TaxID=56 RepID=A0A4P2Q4B3_SORCE|nr:response regulator transcription factor [Sorangium cellulosum]AUX24011.1 transcriptional regulator [Sorangium cellulosum]